MKCPYCENGMLCGYIPNAVQPVQWIPKDEKPSPWRGGLAKRAVQLGKKSFLRESKASAFYCPNCEVVIIPAK